MSASAREIVMRLPGFSIENLEQAINDADRDAIHRIILSINATMSDLSGLTAIAVSTWILCQLYERNRFEDQRHGEKEFIGAVRELSRHEDSTGVYEALERFLLVLSGQDGRLVPRYYDPEACVRLALEYINRAYANSGLKIEDVANYVFVSTSYLSQLLRRETGKTFTEHLTEIRMERAARMLIQTNRKAYEVAAKCGYANVTYFGTVFRQTYGVTPIEYRRMHSGTNAAKKASKAHQS